MSQPQPMNFRRASGIDFNHATLADLQSRSRRSSIASPVISTAQVDVVCRSMVPYSGPNTCLTQAQVDGTLLLTRLHNEKVSRIVRIASVTAIASLFQQCEKRWPEKQLGNKFRFLAHFDEIDGYLEVVQSCSSDFVDFMQLLNRQWAKASSDVIYVPVMLVLEGGGFTGL